MSLKSAPEKTPADVPPPRRRRWLPLGRRWGDHFADRAAASWVARLVVILAVLAAVMWSFKGTGVGLRSLIEGRAGAERLIGGLFPPDLGGDLVGRVVTAMIQTLEISIAGLFFGAVIGLPLAVLIAGNTAAPGWLSSAARLAAAMLRGVPELLWGLLFVATVGLGPAAGVYAISLHAAGMLAKLCSEQLESVDPGPVEALRLTGTSRPATLLLGIVPQARNGLASLLLYQWECNIRQSTVIGFVGAGGIGQALSIALRLFRYQELATLLVAVLVLVLGADTLSRMLRRRMGAATR